ncbi:hypothetical protein Glove_494g12 [Diversispora epigaea]|uniref:Uncharacterized protein n=1 Tax=Diversispora epigaea TaxID=1348612 RepID=A0A397GRG5_9GLOM|nr:hypothetical protein Glove_494g12 [Diversispora epigaea]
MSSSSLSTTLQNSNSELVFKNILFHISDFCIFFISVICLLIFHLNIISCFLVNFTKSSIMFTTERSRDFGKWCVTLGQGILALALMDISEKSLLSSSFQKYITPTSQISPKFIIQKPIPSSLSKRSKSQSQSQKQLPKQKKELPSLSMIGEVTLKRNNSSNYISTKNNNNIQKQQHCPSISSSLSPNRTKDWKKIVCPSKRYSTPVTSSIPSYLIKSKRNMSVKLLISTAANRIMIYQKSRTAAVSQLSHNIYGDNNNNNNYNNNTSLIIDEPTSIKKSNFLDDDEYETIVKDNNLKLVEDRPTIYQQRRRLHKKQSPSTTLQVARGCLKMMLKIKNHRNTI